MFLVKHGLFVRRKVDDFVHKACLHLVKSDFNPHIVLGQKNRI